MAELGIDSLEAYRAFLQREADEWSALDSLCRISISRFFRDQGVFAFLQDQVMPMLAEAALQRGDKALRIWSAGCGSGEEPYSLAIMWRETLRARFPGLGLDIVATDANSELVARARDARYAASSLRELPETWRRKAFAEDDSLLLLKEPYRAPVSFRVEDVRRQMPEGPFDLIACRNLAFTYFDEVLQREVLAGLAEALLSGGALVIGSHERLPEIPASLRNWSEQHGVYRKIAQTCRS